ncbi:hypothetical protein PACTADRAFT_23540, partial [Pachysolen tannophilus NRRL Y-2460]
LNNKIPLSHTLWSPSDTVKDVAESLGLSNLNDEVAKNLAMDVEYRIHEILEQAIKFMRHSKRKTLTTQDIDRSLKALNLEPLYGYDATRPLVFKEAIVGAGSNLYYIDDDVVPFEKLINQPLPKIPRHCTFTAHWLSIEGIQPSIPQNPLVSDIKQISPFLRGSMQNLAILNSDEASSTVTQQAQQAQQQQQQQAADNGAVQNGLNQNLKNNKSSKDLDVKPLVKHVLSKELQLYFDRVIGALMNENYDDPQMEHLKSAALNSIRSDPGLHQLVPYFIQFIAETITNNLKNLAILSTMLEVIYSLLMNQTIFLEPYVHALMPCILTLLLAKKIGENANIEHFATRDFASSLLEHIVKKYGSSFSTLKPRITRTLLKAFLDTNKPIGTQYGSIIGLRSLGDEVIRIVMLGNLKNWANVVLNDKDTKFNNDERKILLDSVLNSLRVLKINKEIGKEEEEDKDKMEVEAEENEGVVIDDTLKNKLNQRIGNELSQEILKQDDALDIVKGIFFGEL